ncbi:MAG: Phosphotransferase enzyme family protein [Methanocella sp. PtaU1.Bin125]|nr:MAG: Phosphotransferase enzyme family protein [Methanocella sp. PtaU1.Bin125]
MLELKEDIVTQWMLQLAREHPELFGRGGERDVAALPGREVASHGNRTYRINGRMVHVKFFGRALGRTGTAYEPAREMEAEYRVLREFERRGFTAGRYQVARALGYNVKADCALATLHVDGESLLSLMTGAIKGERSETDLYGGLELAAGLLKRIHTVMPHSRSVDQCELFYPYLKSVIYLEERGELDGYHRRIMKGLAGWYSFRPLFSQRGVTVHGDANPSNFKISEGTICTFDMERSRPRHSPCVDLSSMVAELYHQFACLAHNASAADPFVGHFLHAYEPDGRARREIMRLLPFFVSRKLFKIAMLGYWNHGHRKFLIELGTRQIEVRPV